MVSLAPPEQPAAAGLDAHGLHQAALSLLDQIEVHFYHLGEVLRTIRDTHAYEHLGHASFESYLADGELAIRRRAAMRYIRIVELYTSLPSATAHLVTHADLAQMRESRAELALPAILDADPADVPEIVAEAKTLAVSDLRKRVKERRGEAVPDVWAWLDELGEALMRRAARVKGPARMGGPAMEALGEIATMANTGFVRLRSQLSEGTVRTEQEAHDA